MYGQEAYAGYDCVTLLDSTAVTVQPTGSGAFAVCKAFKVQTPKGAVANRIIKYDYDPLTAHAEFRYATIYRANGDVINLDVTGACDYAAPARAIYWGARQIMLEVGRLQPGVRDRQERFHLRLADGGRRRAFHPSYAGTVLRYRPLLGYRAYRA